MHDSCMIHALVIPRNGCRRMGGGRAGNDFSSSRAPLEAGTKSLPFVSSPWDTKKSAIFPTNFAFSYDPGNWDNLVGGERGW